MTLKVRWTIIFAGGFFLFLDQILKWLAMNGWVQSRLINNFFGWELFLNPGIAFSIRLSNTAIIALTFPMITVITYLFIKSSKESGRTFLAWTFVLAGAISNLIDRILYKNVVDYFRIFTGVINIADILIASGLVIYLLSTKSKKTN